MRFSRSLLLLAAFLTIAGGCTRATQDRDDLGRALYRTETMARQFVYKEKAGAQTTSVEGVIADDYRYQLAATIDGRQVASEVVLDDARALQITDPQLLTSIGSSGRAAPGATDALGTGKWVLDPAGANQLWSVVPPTYEVGTDPLHDALSMLKYAKSVAGESAGVLKFNPEAAGYRPKFDPFPRPADGVIRYDLLTPVLVPRDPSGAGAAVFRLPGPEYFRRMSVYVQEGVVTEIRERISVEDILEDPRSRIEARLGDYNIELPENASTKAKAEFLLGFLNEASRQSGQPRIRPRHVEMVLKRLPVRGEANEITLPADAVKASLAGLRDYGQVLFEQAER